MTKLKKTLSELFALQIFAIKLGLDNITYLSAQLDNPHLQYPAIHIAGTNGKGSTAMIMQQILMHHGLKVGLFTSPHLVQFNERIRVNNDLIKNEFIIQFWEKMQKTVLQLKATFFDTTTCMAFEYFKQEQVDIAIFETGLGGRLDSTNIIQPELAVITPISFDHHKQLGNTLTKIASEKAGIIKNKNPVFLAKQITEIEKYFKQHFKSFNLFHFNNLVQDVEIQISNENTIFSFKDKLRNKSFEKLNLKLLGSHQAQNACLAYLIAHHYLDQIHIKFEEQYFRNALLNINWPGRLQKINNTPEIYLDVSHNQSGFETTVKFIRSIFPEEKRKLLIGLLDDKEYKKIVQITKNEFSQIWITEPVHHRKLDGKLLQQEYLKNGKTAIFIKEIKDTLETLLQDLAPEDVLFIMGSHYLAGTIQAMKLQKT